MKMRKNSYCITHYEAPQKIQKLNFIFVLKTETPLLCLSVHLSMCLSVCPSVCLSVYVSVCLLVCLSACLSVCLSACLCVSLSIYLSIYLSVILPADRNTKFVPPYSVRLQYNTVQNQRKKEQHPNPLNDLLLI